MIKALFDGYVQHITEEIETLQVDRGYSATWAAGEARYLQEPLFHFTSSPGRHNRRPVTCKSPAARERALSGLKTILVEIGGKREIFTLE